MSIDVVIMAGGSGTRLWPLSRSSLPKQFIPLMGEDTMFQATIMRLRNISINSITVICNYEHRFIVADQISKLKLKCKIILEPIGRNTAPAIALAAIDQKKEDSLLLVLAADHYIKDIDSFENAINMSIPDANEGKLITYGIVPSSPNENYGYIKKGKKIGSGYKVVEFIEKPSKEKAKKLLNSQNYFWNSGMFLFRSDVYLSELKKYRPDIYDCCLNSIVTSKRDDYFVTIKEEVFRTCQSDSIDYAVMENTSQAHMVPMNAGWSDLGSWSSLWDIKRKDKKGNFIHGDIISHQTSNSFLYSEKQLMATINLDDIVVVASEDVIMISDKKNCKDVGLIVEKLKTQKRLEWREVVNQKKRIIKSL